MDAKKHMEQTMRIFKEFEENLEIVNGMVTLSTDFLLQEIVRRYKATNGYDVDREPLDGDAVEDLISYLREKINIKEGNV